MVGSEVELYIRALSFQVPPFLAALILGAAYLRRRGRLSRWAWVGLCLLVFCQITGPVGRLLLNSYWLTYFPSPTTREYWLAVDGVTVGTSIGTAAGLWLMIRGVPATEAGAEKTAEHPGDED